MFVLIVLALPQAVVFHLWSRAYRHTFQADIAVDHAAKSASQAYVKRLLGIKVQDANELQIEEHHALDSHEAVLGPIRSLQDFWLHCKVHKL